MKPSKKTVGTHDIEKYDVGDGVERYLIDSHEKLFLWVDSKFKEQKVANKELVIDFSNLVILLNSGNDWFWIGRLCGKIDGSINLGDEKEIQPDARGGVIIKNEIQFEIKHKVSFENSIIYNTNFYNTKFHGGVTFRNTRLFGGTSFKGSIFMDSAEFTQIDISQLPKENENLPSISGYISFQNIKFLGKVSFNCNNWYLWNNFHFSNNTYEDDVEFTLCSITNQRDNYYNFSDSIFKGDVIIDNRPNSDAQSKVSYIDFGNSYFHKKLKVWGVTIGNISMQNCHFHDTVSITYNKYNEESKLDFSYSTIDCLFFIDSDLGDAEGETIKLTNEIRFYKTLIKPNTFLFLRNINNSIELHNTGRLNFGYANILGNITIQDSNLEQIIFGKATVTGSINIENVKTDFDCRESITKVKHEFSKRGDIINALSYRSSEMAKYRSELWADIKKWKLEKITDLFLLGLNTVSNNNGRWWLLGLGFTIGVSFLFYSLFSLSMGYSVWSVNINNWVICDPNYWKNVLGFLWLPNLEGFKELTDTKLNASLWSYVWFIIGKIAVAYGIYQTISAFRKYGK